MGKRETQASATSPTQAPGPASSAATSHGKRAPRSRKLCDSPSVAIASLTSSSRRLCRFGSTIEG